MTTTIAKKGIELGLRAQWFAEIKRPEITTLAQVVGAAVRKIDEESVIPLPGNDRYNSKRLLALLAWSYARQSYGSVEIVAVLRSPAATEFWRGLPPEEGDIRRFRDENRVVLEKCLHAALHFQAEQNVAAGLISRINETHVVREAARRVIMAMFLDSVGQFPGS